MSREVLVVRAVAAARVVDEEVLDGARPVERERALLLGVSESRRRRPHDAAQGGASRITRKAQSSWQVRLQRTLTGNVEATDRPRHARLRARLSSVSVHTRRRRSCSARRAGSACRALASTRTLAGASAPRRLIKRRDAPRRLWRSPDEPAPADEPARGGGERARPASALARPRAGGPRVVGGAALATTSSRRAVPRRCSCGTCCARAADALLSELLADARGWPAATWWIGARPRSRCGARFVRAAGAPAADRAASGEGRRPARDPGARARRPRADRGRRRALRARGGAWAPTYALATARRRARQGGPAHRRPHAARPRPLVAALGLGATRPFHLKRRGPPRRGGGGRPAAPGRRGERTFEVPVPHNSLPCCGGRDGALAPRRAAVRAAAARAARRRGPRARLAHVPHGARRPRCAAAAAGAVRQAGVAQGAPGGGRGRNRRPRVLLTHDRSATRGRAASSGSRRGRTARRVPSGSRFAPSESADHVRPPPSRLQARGHVHAARARRRRRRRPPASR